MLSTKFPRITFHYCALYNVQLYSYIQNKTPGYLFCLIKGSLHKMLCPFWNSIRYQKSRKLNFELGQKMNKIYLTLNIKEKREKRKLPGS
jgi:hypothetical protein